MHIRHCLIGNLDVEFRKKLLPARSLRIFSSRKESQEIIDFCTKQLRKIKLFWARNQSVSASQWRFVWLSS